MDRISKLVFALIRVLDSTHIPYLIGRLPKHKEGQWLNLFDLAVKDVKIKIEVARLCSKHFAPEDFTVAKSGAKLLKRGSIPTIRVVDGYNFLDEYSLKISY